MKPTTVATRAVRGSGERPEDESASQRFLHTELVDEEADERREHCVGEGERRRDPSVVDIIPAERALQRGLQHRQRVAIDVVDRRREEQQRADDPTVVADMPRDRSACIATGVIGNVVSTHSATPQGNFDQSLYAFFREFVGELRSEQRGFVFRQTVLDHQAREERAVDAARDVMTRRDRHEGTRVVVEADRVVEARSLGSLLAETHHAFGAVVEPPRRPELECRVVPGEWRELARVAAFVECENDDRQRRVIAEPIEQRAQRADVVGGGGNIRHRHSRQNDQTAARCDCARRPDESAAPCHRRGSCAPSR
jgi:hypothetical protein